jgi:hypothetical protein
MLQAIFAGFIGGSSPTATVEGARRSVFPTAQRVLTHGRRVRLGGHRACNTLEVV